MNQYTVKKEDSSTRIDKFVSKVFKEISRSFISKNIVGFVSVDGKQVKQSYKLKEGENVSIDSEGFLAKYQQELNKSENEGKIIPQKGTINVFYEDKDLLVLNKSAGLVVHPGIGHEKDTLANYVKQYLMDKGEYDVGISRGGIVHRLDMPVGGLILFAKNRKSQKHFMKQFECHEVLKVYLANYEVLDKRKVFDSYKKINLVNDLIKQYKNGMDLGLQDWIEVEGVMKRDPSNRKRMLFQRNIFNEKLRYAKSYLLPLSESKMCVLIKTGRMHQIRATLRNLGIVLIGDRLYGSNKDCADKIGLNSVVLGIVNLEGERKVFNLLDEFDV